MSAKIMGEVWGLALPREQKYVLVSLADHADHEGCHVFPSVGLVAWKTDYSERQVRRIMAELEKAGVIVPTERQSGSVTEYRIDLSDVPRKAARNTRPGRPAKDPSAKDTRPENSAQKPPDILTLDIKTPGHSGDKPRTFTHIDPGHFDTPTPDIFDTPYSLYETSLETSLEPSENKRGVAPTPAPSSSKSKPQKMVHVAHDPPTLDQVQEWLTCHNHDCRVAVGFLSHYGANGWHQNGGKAVYSWPHALAGWVDREAKFSKAGITAPNGPSNKPDITISDRQDSTRRALESAGY